MRVSREITIKNRYLHLPVCNDAPSRRMRLLRQGEVVRAFDIELVDTDIDFWAYTDVSSWAGERLTIDVDDPKLVEALAAIQQSDEAPLNDRDLYDELYRPQFHFSTKRGWHNDPNGLTYYDGEYHLFFQHNPYAIHHGNMHWGHAVSGDLLHWEELGDALYPDHLGTCYSGSGVVDAENTAGFRKSDDDPLVCIYTSAGGRTPECQGQPFTQSLAYSTDRGHSWTKYADNPVLEHLIDHNRDPKVIWHAESQRWIMALYLSGNDFGLFRSPDLKSWTQTCTVTLTDCIECPDLFPLPVESDPTDVHWVFWGGNGTYLVGDFDGECFTPHGPTRRHDWGGDSYAAQTWSNAPIHDGRRFQIAWLRVTLPEMPFNQCMTFPCELTLRRISQGHPSGVRLFSEPIRAIERLHRRSARWLRNRVRPGRKPLDAIKGECWHIRGIFRPGGATRFALEVRGVPITYEVAAERLHCQGRSMPLPLQDGLIDLEILVDRVSIEIFGNSGQVALPVGVLLSKEPETLALEVEGGTLMMELLEAFTLRSIWG